MANSHQNKSVKDNNRLQVYSGSNRSDLIGYNVVRDGELLDLVTSTSYDDGNVVPDVEYCYIVEAVYDEGTSSSSNQSCASASRARPRSASPCRSDSSSAARWRR